MGEPSGVEFQRVHPGLLKEIIVRPILPGERWEELMRRHHYLGFSRRVEESRCGRALRRVVCPAWLACGGPQVPASRPFYRLAPAPAVSAPSAHRQLPLSHPAPRPSSESRLAGLIPESQTPRCRLAAVHGHRLLLAETLVDPQRFRGACYRPPTGGQPAATPSIQCAIRPTTQVGAHLSASSQGQRTSVRPHSKLYSKGCGLKGERRRRNLSGNIQPISRLGDRRKETPPCFRLSQAREKRKF